MNHIDRTDGEIREELSCHGTATFKKMRQVTALVKEMAGKNDQFRTHEAAAGADLLLLQFLSTLGSALELLKRNLLLDRNIDVLRSVPSNPFPSFPLKPAEVQDRWKEEETTLCSTVWDRAVFEYRPGDLRK